MSLVPLYRLVGHGDHFYTTDATERDNAISQFGYASEGIACYVNDSSADLSASDSADNEAFWRACYLAALGNQEVRNSSTVDEFHKYAEDSANRSLLLYSNAVRRLRGQS